MSNTSLETIEVKRPTKYGFQSTDDTMYGISKYGTEAGVTPESFKAGTKIVAKIYMSASGKKYVTAAPKIVGEAVPTEAPKAEAPKAAVVAAGAGSAPTKYGRAMSKYDLETDTRIHVSGIVQAVIGSPIMALATGIDPKTFGELVESLSSTALAVANKLVQEKLSK